MTMMMVGLGWAGVMRSVGAMVSAVQRIVPAVLSCNLREQPVNYLANCSVARCTLGQKGQGRAQCNSSEGGEL